MSFSPDKVLLSIIIPCYNPQNGLAENVVRHFQKIKNEIPDIRLVLVNDGSTNITSEEILHLLNTFNDVISISHKPNKGKGYALREGVRTATSDLIIYTDVDFPYTYESFIKIYSELQSGKTDVAVGIRGEEYYTHLPPTRVRISKLLRWFIKKFLRIPTDDTQCGLKGMNQKGKEVFLQTTINRYLFDLEFIFLAARKKLRIKTIEVELRPEIVLSKMNWKILLQEFGNFLKIFTKSMTNKQ